jgi:hypothetical protein
MKNEVFRYFNENVAYLKKSLRQLDASYQKCSAIGVKSDYNDEELESYESLTARYARSTDILTQKLIRALLRALHEFPQTIIDTANILERFGLVKDADEFIMLRELRNKIAHEYVDENLYEIFEQVLNNVYYLHLLADKVIRFFEKKFNVKID